MTIAPIMKSGAGLRFYAIAGKIGERSRHGRPAALGCSLALRLKPASGLFQAEENPAEDCGDVKYQLFAQKEVLFTQKAKGILKMASKFISEIQIVQY